jgi:hypothetical protein
MRVCVAPPPCTANQQICDSLCRYDYSAQELLVYDDGNYPIYDGHPRMQGLVYVDKHVQVIARVIGHVFTVESSRACSQAKTHA